MLTGDLAGGGDDVRAGFDAEQGNGVGRVIGLCFGRGGSFEQLRGGERPENSAQAVLIRAGLADHGMRLLVGDGVGKAIHAGLSPQHFTQRHRGKSLLLQGMRHAEGGWVKEIECQPHFFNGGEIQPPAALERGRGVQRTESAAGIVLRDDAGRFSLVMRLQAILATV